MIALRHAEPQDAMEVASIHVRSWQAAYRGLMPDAYLDQLRPEDRAQKYNFGSVDSSGPLTILAVDAGTICGFATIAAARDAELVGYGELCALYVDPARWKQGIGVALIAEARAQLLAAGFEDAALWVLAGNTRAERFYARDGWESDGRSKTTSVWNLSVNEVCYQRRLKA